MRMRVTIGGDISNSKVAKLATEIVASLIGSDQRTAANTIIDTAAAGRTISGVWSEEHEKLRSLSLPYVMSPEPPDASPRVERVLYWSPTFGELQAWRDPDGIMLLPIFDLRAAMRASQRQQARFLSWIDGITHIPPIKLNAAAIAALEGISWRRIRVLSNERSAIFEAALKATK